MDSIWKVAKELVLTALGKVKADLVIKNGTLVNVNSGEVLENIDVAIKKDRIALIGNADHCVGEATKIIDAKGKYITPGFLDAHVHIESSMLTVTQFARAVIPHGTTTIFADPHEIANVLGLQGVKLMINESKKVPLRVYITAPSCVPASPEFETPGAILGPQEIEEMLRWDDVIALGEMMDFPGVLSIREDVIEKINAAHRMNKLIEGHDAGLQGNELIAYAAAGISSSHELTTKIDAINRIRLGMYAYLREGSAWLDVEETIKAITEEKLDHRHVCLVTDDREADSIKHEGHMDYVVRRAIEEGMDPVKAIQMATLNPAEHYRLDREIGSIAPSRKADILIIGRLTKVDVEMVFIDGELVAKDGEVIVDIPSYKYPKWATKSINVKKKLKPDDFRIRVTKKEGHIKARIIKAKEGNVLTEEIIDELPVHNNLVYPLNEGNIYKLAVIERHKATGNIGLGFVKGFGFKIGAVASTVAHDSHNIIVLGTDDKDMAAAVNKLIETGGGIITVKNGETLSFIELPIAGLMSNQPYEVVAEKLDEMYKLWNKLGCKWRAPFMTLSLLALPVLPELRLTDKGLIDTVNQKFVSIFVE